ncbi:MAG: hypothetical protein QOE21_1045 [Microbacteriaceae bacterium]|nr:hypothetical protein [Microbacteriaceae bacterium]
MNRFAATRSGFVGWYRGRPFVGGALTVLAGLEMFFSGQLDVGKIHIQVGIEGLQATIIPILMVILGVFAVTMPVHRVFYGVISLVVSVYSLIGVNLGGFFIGMLLGSVGGVMIVSWLPKTRLPETAMPRMTAAGSGTGTDPEPQPERPKPKPWPQPEAEAEAEPVPLTRRHA